MNEGSFKFVQLLMTLGSVEERLEAALEPLGLSLAKFNVLAQLTAAEEPLPLSTLADRCACVRSNITQLIDRLEADKLVARTDDPRDRRSIRAELTEGGRALYRSGLAEMRRMDEEIFRPLSAPQRRDLVAYLSLIQ